MSIEAPTRKTLKTEQSEKTRAALLRVARAMFAESGFAATSLELVAERAGVTTGAVYHQYRDKRRLFQAVVEELDAEVFQSIRERSREHVDRQAWQRLVAAAELILDSFTDPVYCQIVMVDGPAVLGWKVWHEIRANHILRYIRDAFEAQMALGRIAREPAEPLAHVVFGGFTEAGLAIANAADKRAARRELGAATLRMFNRLKLRDAKKKSRRA
ncbi:MAG TPA: TetR/AcrR family transcriptional regulator [Candidatus Binataceae bacterium]|nr:TetR/AcrR family transcriptional regulator [Candidatus Binataceae bacterium]